MYFCPGPAGAAGDGGGWRLRSAGECKPVSEGGILAVPGEGGAGGLQGGENVAYSDGLQRLVRTECDPRGP